MKMNQFTLAILGTLFGFHAAAFESRLPSFLPPYFRSVFDNANGQLMFDGQRETNGVTQFVYSIGSKEALSVENMKGDAPACRAAFKNIEAHLNLTIATNSGDFTEITETELHAELRLTNMSQSVFVFVLPGAVTIWTHSTSLSATSQIHPDFQKIRTCVNRQRYEDALSEGNVTMGQWGKSIHSYERDLMKVGKMGDAMIVLKNLLVTSPFDYEAHLDYMDRAPALPDATNSARVVLKNAELQDQISRAAGFLGVKPPTMDDIPLLSTNDTGLVVVLIPLPPCNPWLLEEAAKVYERITDIPVRFR
ncbi:MAG: hypothetical protein JWO95_2660, partial [Verrucomicrobiales bacterium]|nr:hypothetical protein [Verrucomicrobiales bacterium]